MSRRVVFDPVIESDRYEDWQMKQLHEMKCRDCMNSRLPSTDGYREYDEICYCEHLRQFVESDDSVYGCGGFE